MRQLRGRNHGAGGLPGSPLLGPGGALAGLVLAVLGDLLGVYGRNADRRTSKAWRSTCPKVSGQTMRAGRPLLEFLTPGA